MARMDSNRHSNAGRISNGGTNFESAMDDLGSPYFLHHSYGLGLILVSQLLTGENYASWSRSIMIAFSVKNELGFIDGSINKPIETDIDLFDCWCRNSNIVIAWLSNSVSKEISGSILYLETTSQIWSDKKERFQQSNGQRIFQLHREQVNLR